jgi:adenylylsulfate kinase
MSKLFIESGTIILTAFISPFRKERRQVRSMMPHGDFIEIYVNCPIEVCEKRDVKGLYRRARTGEVKEFTGISSPYEIPQSADLTVNTDLQTLEESVENIIDLLKEKGVF